MFSLQQIIYCSHDKIMMIIDFEHLATQGADPKQVINELVQENFVPDIGKYIIAIHSNYPSPLHSHKIIFKNSSIKFHAQVFCIFAPHFCSLKYWGRLVLTAS